jgi:hypothetical protein
MKQAGHTNPFEGEKTRVLVRDRTELEARLLRHRWAVHRAKDTRERFNCLACRVLENQLKVAK